MMPRKDPLPAAARQYSRAGRGVTSRGPGKTRPSSAPNTKARTNGVMAATASSGAKRRQSVQAMVDNVEDSGKAALNELLKTYKTKAERELAGGGGSIIRQPLKARYK